MTCLARIAPRRRHRDAGVIEPFHDTPTEGPRPDRGSTLRSAAVYVVSVFAFAIAFLVVGSVLYDPVPLWVLVVFPLLVFAGAVGALYWTFRCGRPNGPRRWPARPLAGLAGSGVVPAGDVPVCRSAAPAAH